MPFHSIDNLTFRFLDAIPFLKKQEKPLNETIMYNIVVGIILCENIYIYHLKFLWLKVGLHNSQLKYTYLLWFL